MTAIITPALFFPSGTPNIAFDAPPLTAAAIDVLVVWKSRSVLLTVLLGMFSLGITVYFALAKASLTHQHPLMDR